MAKPLRVLNVEDSKRDAALLMRHLTKAGYEVFTQRVQTEPAMTAALNAEKWDIVLCDYAMPKFDALRALAALRSSSIDIPFIIISGTVGEEIAVEAMLSGAHDYLSKDNLTRLVPAIEREIRDANIRKELRWEGEERRVSESRYRALFEHAPDGIVIADPAGTYIDANVSICKMLGYSRDEIVGRSGGAFVVDMKAQDIMSAMDQITSGAEYSHERQYRRKDGSIFTGEVTATVMPDGNVLGLIRDISERKEAQHLKQRLTSKIESQRNRLDTIVESVPGIVWETSQDLHRTVEGQDFVSGYVMTMLGYSVEEWLATSEFWLTIVHEDDRERVRAKAEAALIAGESSTDEFRWVRKDGRVIWVEQRSAVIRDEDGNQIGVRGVTIDVSERRRADDERRIISEIGQGAVTTPNLDEYLKLVHRLIAQIVNAENCFVMLYDPVTDIEHYEFWVDKHDPHPSPGSSERGFTSYVHRTGKPLFLTSELEKQLIAEGEVEHIGKPSACWLGVPLRTRERTIGVLVIQHYEDENACVQSDLDFIASVGDHVALAIERKRSEQAIQESEQRFANAFEHAPIGVALVSPDGRWLKANRMLCEMIGYTQVDLLSLTFQEITHPDDLDADTENVRMMLAGEISSYQMEKRYFHKDGHLVTALLSVSLVRDANGLPQYFISQIQDITGRKAAEQQLQLHSVLLNSIGQAVIVTDAVGTITYWNAFAEEMYGWTSSEAMGLNILDVTPAKTTRQQGANIMSALMKGESWSGEYTVQKRDGTPFPIFVTNTPLMDGNGNVESIIGISLDVTERKQDEEKLRESESLLSSTQRIAHIGSWVMELSGSGTLETARLFWSDEKIRIFGFEPGEVEITPDLFFNSVHPDDRDLLKDTLRAEIEDKRSFSLEHRIILPDGRVRTVHAIGEAVFDIATGKTLKLVGSVQDITERKTTEESLIASEERYRLLFEKNPQPMWVFDAKTLRFLQVNDAAVDHYGFSRDEFLSMTILDMRPAEDIPALLKSVKNDRSDLLTGESWRHRKKDGTVIDVEVSSHTFSFGGTPAKLVLANDITERKRAEEALSNSEELYRELVENATDMMYTLDMAGNFTSINRAAEKIIGYTDEESRTMNTVQLVAPEYREIAAQNIASRLAGRDVTSYEIDIIAKDGHRVPVEVNTRIIYENGAPIGVQGIARDITQRKLQEEARLASERKYQDIFNLAPVGIYQSVADGSLITVNSALAEMLGYDSENEILNKNIADLYFLPDDRPELISRYEDRGSATDIEIRWKRKDGSLIWIQLTCHAVRTNSGAPEYFEGFVRDITETKQMNEALRESETRLRTIIATEPECVKLLARDGSLLEMNPAGLRMIEADSFAEVLNYRIDGLVAKQDRRAFRQLTEKVFRGESGMLEFQIVGLKGTHRWLDTHASPLLDASGKITALLGITRDITESKLVTEALRASNEKFHQLADNITDVFWIRSPDMNTIHYISPAYEQIWGRKLKSDYADPHEWHEFIFPQDRQSVKEAYAGLMTDRSEIEVEFRILRPDGEQRWVRARGFQVKDASGDVIRLAGIVTDITEKKQAETDIELTLQRLQDAQRIGQIGDFTWDKATGTITWSYEIFEIVGRDPELGPPKDYEEMQACFDMPSREAMDANVALAIESGETRDYELVAVRPDGERVYIQATSEPRKDSSGEVVGLRGTIQNISTRKQTEASLEQSEFRYHSLFENMLEGYAYCETVFEGDELCDFIYTEVNDAFGQLTGLEDVVGKKVSEVIPGARDLSPDLFGVCGRVALTGEPERFESFIEPLNIWLSITVYSSQRESFVAVFDNITERKRARASLVESQEQLKLATEAAGIGIWDWDPVEDTIKWDARMYDLYGNHGEDFSGPRQTWSLNHHADDDERVVEELATAFKGPEDFHSEFRVVWPNGEVRHLESSAKVMRDKNGRALRFIGVNWDITERKAAEETLREADQRAIREYGLLLTRVAKLALALGNARDLDTVFEELYEFALVSTGMDGLIISLYDARQNTRTAAYVWSEGVKVDASTLPPMEMSDSPHSRSVLTGEVIITDDFQSVMKGQPVVHLGGDKPQSSLVVPMSVMGKIVGGVEVQSNDLAALNDTHATAMQMAANLAANAIENVRLLESERIQAEQLRQSQKIEAVGVLAGGIAHDFNNLLTAINGYSALTLKRMSEADPFRQNIEEVKKAGDRAAELTSQLLAFSRKQVLNPVVHNLNPVIANIENMLRRIIKENIQLTTVLDANLGNVKADPGQVEQIVMNLAVNARDAMPDGGKLTIETTNVYLDEKYVSQNLTISPGQFVKLTVTDTGTGMDAKTTQHIFEPFFTTKEVGKGTGLGLSMVHGIVKQSGGDIMVYSEPGHGSVFKIYFPCVDEAVHIARWKDDTETGLSGTETILVVEDEEVVLNLVVEILTSSGYKVLTAVSGKDGLSLFEESTDPIHLLLTDVIMPTMGGAELRDRIVALKPEIKVLFMSGYSDEAISSKGVLDADSAFIEKPFTPDDLARKVREVLG